MSPAPAGGADRTLAVLQHVPFEGPGRIAALAESRGIDVEVVRLDLGEALPSPAAISGLVVMGGPMNVDEVGDYAWLVPERALIADALRVRVPTLGVCLGAQMIARSQGGRVFAGPAEEIGMGHVDLTPAAAQDPLLEGEGVHMPCFHWHGDTFELPPGALRLAGSGTYPNQAFRVGSGWGLQFHVEVDEELAEQWRGHLPDGIEIDAESLRAVGERVIGRFLDRVEVAPR